MRWHVISLGVVKIDSCMARSREVMSVPPGGSGWMVTSGFVGSYPIGILLA